ncbi:hypothetical protein [Sphingomonas sp. BK580]|uniref:hypothetical protein n=1 Tax=Sphingomonas sp. BK580 TaxID=2586972 RepID=UPI0016171A90|nr:hypothetical protein [Sphingomonas sp. BK580]MBB3692449.1 hypothetical protein [Sphingomonas sp. BK580]
MGLFSGSSTTKTNEKFDTGPSSFQAPYLNNAFGSAKDIYGSSKGTPYYEGKTYAAMSAGAQDALAKLKAYASGQGLNTATTLGNLGSQMAGYGAKAGSTLDQFAAMAGQDPTQANIAAATAYANNPAIQGMIDANARDVTRNLSESILPGIDRAASATGNINSSRAGVASGIAQRGAADRIGDISAQIRGDAYDRGLSLAQSDRSTNLSALGQAASSYGNLASFGVDALGKSNDAAYGAFDAIKGADAADQADRQGQLTADFQKWQGQDSRATDLLDRYAKIVAGNQWGQSGTSSGTTKSTQSGSILSQLAGAAAAGASIYTGLSPKQS